MEFNINIVKISLTFKKEKKNISNWDADITILSVQK